MEKIRQFIKEVYAKSDNTISHDALEKEVENTLDQVKAGNWTAIYSEVCDNLTEYGGEFWHNALEKLVGYQRYGAR